MNQRAKYILRQENPKKYEEYETFRKEYDDVIYDCWYVSVDPARNVLLGYKLVKEIAEGAFGHVYEALDKNDKKVVVKLLKGDVRSKPEMLQSFRRGVAAMKILSDENIKGMVSYTDCSEIPAFVVMDYIEGPNLKEAFQRNYLEDWHDVLRFGVELTTIIRKAHQLPQRVLHRDLRPPNIMLKNYETDPENAKVVVLDFDLSWYRDAIEVSVAHQPALYGYLSPEQLERTPGVSTKNAAVDSFGLGMTLYYMRTGRDPVFMQQKHVDWESKVFEIADDHPYQGWVSLPIRYANLIIQSTKHKQSERCDVAEIKGELEQLLSIIENPNGNIAIDLLCQEIATRCASSLGIKKNIWDYDTEKAIIQMASGVKISIGPNWTSQSIKGLFEWSNTGPDKYKNVSRYLPDKTNRALSILKLAKAKVKGNPSYNVDSMSFLIEFNCVNKNEDIEEVSSAFVNAMREFRFD